MLVRGGRLRGRVPVSMGAYGLACRCPHDTYITILASSASGCSGVPFYGLGLCAGAAHPRLAVSCALHMSHIFYCIPSLIADSAMFVEDVYLHLLSYSGSCPYPLRLTKRLIALPVPFTTGQTDIQKTTIHSYNIYIFDETHKEGQKA